MTIDEKDFLTYEWDEFRERMAEATTTLRKMNEAAIAMRWQYDMENDEAWNEFKRELSDAQGWLSSWCG